jgi:hypothetical protein
VAPGFLTALSGSMFSGHRLCRWYLTGGAGTVAGKVFNLPGLSNLKSSQSGAVTGIVANSVSAIGLGVN